MRDWPLHGPFAIHPRMRAITLDVILRAVFGVEDGKGHDELREQLRKILDLGQSTIAFAPWIRHWTHRPWVKFLALRERVDDLIYREITRRRDRPTSPSATTSSRCCCARATRTVRRCRTRNCATNWSRCWSPATTTATALAWAFDLLLHDRRAMQALIDSLEPGDEYLDAVITETLRIRPVIAQSRAARPAFSARSIHGAGAHADSAKHRPRRLARGPLPTARSVPAGAFRRRRSRDLRLAALRRRCTPLRRRRLRELRDEDRAANGADARDAAGRRPAARKPAFRAVT